MKDTLLATPENVIPLAVKPKPARAPQVASRFKVQPFDNPRTGSKSWRVTGIKRDGSRVRENYADQKAAQCRQIALETEYLTGHRETALQATKLTDVQIRLAEVAFIRLESDQDMPLAIEHWLKHGKALSVAESPRLDDAFTKYGIWLDGECKLRDLSKANLKRRVNVFVNSVPNIRVVDITPDVIENFLAKRNVAAASRITTGGPFRVSLAGVWTASADGLPSILAAPCEWTKERKRRPRSSRLTSARRFSKKRQHSKRES